MYGQLTPNARSVRLRHALIGLTTLAVLAACGGGQDVASSDTPAPTNSASASPSPSKSLKSWSGQVPRRSESPVRVRVESADIDAEIVDVDVDGKGVLTSPKGKAGWYSGDGAVTPGEPGTSIIVGHVTYNEPDVFYNLRKAERGDRITVELKGGRSVEFVVTDTAKFDQDDNIVDKVWEDTDEALLRLVTCDGQRTSSGYTDNLIVYAKRA